MRLTQLATAIVFCALSAATALVAATPATAETISDPETGLNVTLPPGYSAFGVQYGKDKDNPRILLKSNYITNSYCNVSYANLKIPVNPRYDSIAQNWRNRFGKYSVQEREVLGGRPVISNIPNFDENYPLRPPITSFPGRMLSVVFKTPNGYLDISCNAANKDFDKLRPVLESLVRGISLPN